MNTTATESHLSKLEESIAEKDEVITSLILLRVASNRAAREAHEAVACARTDYIDEGSLHLFRAYLAAITKAYAADLKLIEVEAELAKEKAHLALQEESHLAFRARLLHD